MDAGSAAPGVGAVHQVVVHQGARLEPLQRRGSSHEARISGCAAGDEPAGVAELRTQAFATHDEAESRVGELAEVGPQLGEDGPLTVDERDKCRIDVSPEYGIVCACGHMSDDTVGS